MTKGGADKRPWRERENVKSIRHTQAQPRGHEWLRVPRHSVLVHKDAALLEDLLCAGAIQILQKKT
jgi:hypothetical protein